MRTRRPVQTMLLAAAALLLLTGAGPAVPRLASTGSTSSPSFALYALVASGQQFLPLDPSTLADIPDAQPIGVAEMYDRALSEDGSTLVTLENRRTIVVSDAPTGTEHRRFDAPEPIYLARLSRDGTRLVTGIPMECGPGGCPTPVFRLYDTRDGRLVTTLTGTGREFFGPLIDRDARRLYATFVDRGNQQEGSWPLQIASFDLDTGNESGSLTLSNVLYTQGPTRTIDQMPVTKSLTPAIALSPDGTRLAAVDAAASELTVVDTASLTVAATHVFHRPESLAGRAARWLGLAPVPAAAKTLDGRYIDVVFSVDAHYLYLSGVEGTVDDTTAESTGRGLGLTMIETETGEIVATALGEDYVQDVIPAPDRSGIYVSGSSVVPWVVDHVVPYRLHRLDPRTLAPLAEREFPEQIVLALVPAGVATR